MADKTYKSDYSGKRMDHSIGTIPADAPAEDSVLVVSPDTTDKKPQSKYVKFTDISVSSLNIQNGKADYSVAQNFEVEQEGEFADYSAKATGENSVALTGRRYDAPKWPTAQAYGKQSLALGASCEAFGDFSLAAGCGAEAYQRVGIAIGKSCKSGLTQKDFNDMFATDEQKALDGYDATKLNGGLDIQILDDNNKTYDISEAFSLATGVDTEASSWGAFVSGSMNKSMAYNSATFGNQNTNRGTNAFVAGSGNETSVPSTFLFGKNLKQTKGDGLAFVIGKYNEDVGGYAFVVGSGDSDAERKNGFTINSSGQTYMNGAETESLPETLPKAVINRTDLNKSLTSKSNATNWRNGSGIATVVTQEASNSTGTSKHTLIAGHSNKASNASGSSIIAGYENDIASAYYSSILNGKFNTVTHDNCVVGGVGNETTANNQTIFGKYAALDSDAIFMVGDGTADDPMQRSNAFSITTDGRAVISRAPKNYNDAVRKQELDVVDTKYEGITNLLKNDKLDKAGGTISGDVTITGDLTINGTQHINDTENLDVKNAMIYSNSDGATLATNGGIGIKTNSNDVYGIVYDPTSDSVKLGLGTSDTGGKFTFNENEGEPVAVRDDSSKLTNDHLLKWDSTNLKLIDSGKSIGDLGAYTEITYSELVTKIYNSELLPGTSYRITDFVTTTPNDSSTTAAYKSAGHQFDLIVFADTTNKLNCKAHAVLHEGDTYFSSCDLSKWEIWYDINNDTTKYSWADPASNKGKGVIYRMIDEFNNDCPYDFKNIVYLADNLANVNNWIPIPSGATYSIYVYTFSSGLTTTATDTSLSKDKRVYGNKISNYLNLGILKLNNIVLTGVYTYNNIFDVNCSNITLYDSCYCNVFGQNCSSITLHSVVHDCNIGSSCTNIAANSYGYRNIIGNGCAYIYIDKYSSNNTFGVGCNTISLGERCSNNTFGNGCKYDSFDYNSFIYGCIYENNCSYTQIKIAGTGSDSNNIQNIKIRQGVSGSSSSNTLTITLTESQMASTHDITFRANNAEDVILS